MRQFITTDAAAKQAVLEMIDLYERGLVEPLVGYDLETAPICGLEGYPGTVLDESGDVVKVKKAGYLQFVQALWGAQCDPNKLADLGIFIPKKLTAGNESKGVPVRVAWEQCLARVEELMATEQGASKLQSARWSVGTRAAAQAALCDELAALTYQAEVLTTAAESGPSHKARQAAKRELKVVAATQEQVVATLQLYETRYVAESLPTELLLHVLRVGVRGKQAMGKDPVRPGLDPFTSDIFLQQFTFRRKSDGALLSWVFNLFNVDAEIVRPLLRFDATYLGANIQFDLKLTLLRWLEAPKNIWCVSVASRMMFLGLEMRHSLADCAKRFAGVTLSKEERNLFIGVRHENGLPDAALQYAFNDTEVLFPIYDAQLKRAKRDGQEDLIRHYCALSYPTAVTELVGFKINRERWLEFAAQAAQQRDALAQELEFMLLPPEYVELLQQEALTLNRDIEDGTDEDDTDDSEDDEDTLADVRANAIIRISQRGLVLERLPAVVGEPFFTQFFESRRMAPGLNKTARELMETEYIKVHGQPHRFFEAYRQWAVFAKAASTYGKSFLFYLHPITGCIHPSIRVAGTDTGRDASNTPNVLNLPRGDAGIDYRSAFEAPEGYVFGDADMSAAEQRIAADGSLDQNLIALFENDGDNHSVTAALMFHTQRADVPEARSTELEFQRAPVTGYFVPKGWSASELIKFIISSGLADLIGKKYKKQSRQVAKVVAFLFFFGGSPFGLAAKLNLPLSEAEQFFQDFGMAYPQLVVWFKKRGWMPFETAKRGNDGEEYGFADAYNGLRRWFKLPHNPSRWEYPEGMEGQRQFERAQWRYKREQGSIRREAQNVFTQGGNAVLMTDASLELMENGSRFSPPAGATSLAAKLGLGIFPFLRIYDELLCLVPEQLAAEDANPVIEHSMMVACERYVKRCPFKVEADPLSKVWRKG